MELHVTQFTHGWPQSDIEFGQFFHDVLQYFANCCAAFGRIIHGKLWYLIIIAFCFASRHMSSAG